MRALVPGAVALARTVAYAAIGGGAVVRGAVTVQTVVREVVVREVVVGGTVMRWAVVRGTVTCRAVAHAAVVRGVVVRGVVVGGVVVGAAVTCRTVVRAAVVGGAVVNRAVIGAAADPSPRGPRLSDLARIAIVGPRTRPLRAALSALGIAVGVAAIVAVLGLSASSRAGLLAEIDRLGTNLLTVSNGQSPGGGTAELPATAPAMIGRLPGVTAVEATGKVGADVYRNPLIPAVNTNGLTVSAAGPGLPAAVGTSMARGRFLDAATAREPVVVLGAGAAQLLGIDRLWPGERVRLGGRWFYVTGILRPAVLTPTVDVSVFVGFPAAERYLGFDGRPSTIYVRARDDRVVAVHDLLAAQAAPEDPTEVSVSRPSAALEARIAAEGALNVLFLGLGAVALVVGAIGVANIMVVSVLERRSEIGLRRALGATRSHVRRQFLAEAVLIAAAGGVVGVAAGAAATAGYAVARGWTVVIPPLAWGGGFGAAILVGMVAGLLPALRAARMPPTRALWAV